MWSGSLRSLEESGVLHSSIHIHLVYRGGLIMKRCIHREEMCVGSSSVLWRSWRESVRGMYQPRTPTPPPSQQHHQRKYHGCSRHCYCFIQTSANHVVDRCGVGVCPSVWVDVSGVHLHQSPALFTPGVAWCKIASSRLYIFIQTSTYYIHPYIHISNTPSTPIRLIKCLLIKFTSCVPGLGAGLVVVVVVVVYNMPLGSYNCIPRHITSSSHS